MKALGENAYFGSLTVQDFRLADAYAEPEALYDPQAVDEIFKAVARAIPDSPMFVVLEVGGGDCRQAGRGKLGLHIIAHKDSFPAHIPRDSERCKKIYDPEGLYFYLHKAPEPWSLAAEIDYTASRALSPKGRPPKTRRHYLGPSRLAWADLNSTKEPNALPASPSAPDPIPVLDPAPRSARAFEGTAQARLGSALVRGFARGHAIHSRSVYELLRGLEAQNDDKTPERRPSRVSRPGGAPLDLVIVSAGTPQSSGFAGPANSVNVRKGRLGGKNRLKHGSKHLRIATAGRLIPVAKPPRRSPWSRFLRAIRDVFSLSNPSKDPIRSSRAPPRPVTRRAESRFNSLPARSAVDVRVWSRETVSVALRYRSEPSKAPMKEVFHA